MLGCYVTEPLSLIGRHPHSSGQQHWLCLTHWHHQSGVICLELALEINKLLTIKYLQLFIPPPRWTGNMIQRIRNLTS